MDHLTLNLPQELIPTLERHAEKSGTSIPGFIREEPEFRYLHGLPEHKREGISARPEVQIAIRIKDESRRKLEGSAYNATEFIRLMRGGG